MIKQQGYVTLVSTLILVFIVILTVFIGSKGTVLEQKSANNTYRTEVAFENAEEGLRVLMAQLTANPDLAQADYPAIATTTTTSTGTYTAKYFYNAGVNSHITSTGTDSANATRTITQLVTAHAATSPISSTINAALTSLGNITLGGNASSSSIEAGGTLSVSGSASAGSNPITNSNAFKIALLDSNGNILKDSSGNTVYRQMTPNEYFMYYFGNLCPVAQAAKNADNCKAEAKITVQGLTKGYICDGISQSCDNNMFVTEYAAGKRVFWITQNGIKINSKITLGSTTDPVLILIMNNGTVQINGGATIYGVVYVDVPDAAGTYTCSCTATDNAQATNPIYGQVNDITKPIYGDDTTKPIYTLVNSGGTKCNDNSGCKDSIGTVIPKNSRYTTTYQQKIVGYQQKTAVVNYDTTGAIWSSIVYGLTPNANNASICTVNACTSAVTKCTPPNSVTQSGSTTSGVTVSSSCSYGGTAVSGTNNTPVEIDTLGTWDPSGGGNALVQGAVLTSGNLNSSQGAISFNKDSAIINEVPGTPATVTKTTGGWSDIN